MKLFPSSFALIPLLRRSALAASALLLTSLTVLPSAVRAAVPANDNFANAQVFTGTTGNAQGSTLGATAENGEPAHAGYGGYSSVWFSWTPTTTALALFTTSGSNFDTVLAIYTGNSVSTLTEVTSDDDYGALTSQVTFVAHAGTTYHIAVDGYFGSSGNYALAFATNSNTSVPLITSTTRRSVQVGTPFSYQIVATNNPTSFVANNLPAGVTLNTRTGQITGTPTTTGRFQAVLGATNSSGTGQAGLTIDVSSDPVHAAFFNREVSLGNGAYYLAFINGNPFGYYSYLTDQNYIYHFDMGYEYVFDSADVNNGVYLYDFKSRGFFYTSSVFPFPYLYDFTLRSTVYYYPDPNNQGRYNTNGVRYFYVFATGRTITK